MRERSVDGRHKLFVDMLSGLGKAGVLENLILIGGWCQNVYKVYFGDPPEISTLRTADVDFLIPNPRKIEKGFDLPRFFKSVGFDEEFSVMGGYVKYVHPELEIEFLVPELGRGSEKSHEVKELGVTAQPLRYLTLLGAHTMKTRFCGVELVVPEPAAFVLDKLLVARERKKPDKRENDLRAARQIGEYLLRDRIHEERIGLIFSSLPASWKRRILEEASQCSKDLCDVLKQALPSGSVQG